MTLQYLRQGAPASGRALVRSAPPGARALQEKNGGLGPQGPNLLEFRVVTKEPLSRPRRGPAREFACGDKRQTSIRRFTTHETQCSGMGGARRLHRGSGELERADPPGARR